MSQADFERVAVTWQDAMRVLERAIKRLARELKRLLDRFISVYAAEGVAELEIELKLRSEVGLRTDLLALFDP